MKEEKKQLLVAKTRNIVYYWNMDERPRKQYIHVLRSLREELLDIVLEPDPSPEIDLLRRVLSCLPVKLKSTDIPEIIGNIENAMEEWRQCQ